MNYSSAVPVFYAYFTTYRGNALGMLFSMRLLRFREFCKRDTLSILTSAVPIKH